MHIILRLLLSLVLLCPLSAFAQRTTTGQVIDSESKQGIPYVNIFVEDKAIGTSSDMNGNFKLSVPDSISEIMLVFSAIGYENKKVIWKKANAQIQLQPDTKLLNEITVYPRERKGQKQIGDFEKKESHLFMACAGEPWIVARFFPYQKVYDEHKYLDEIYLVTNSRIKNAKFNIRLYSVGEDGMPDKYLFGKNIIGIAKKGKRETKVDVSEYGIRIPKDGFYVAFEWLIIEENRKDVKGTYSETGETYVQPFYSPSFGTKPVETDPKDVYYSKGKWKSFAEHFSKMRERYGRYMTLAVKLVVGD